MVLLGEDIGTLGGVFRVTDGLQRDFGADRVMDTPLAEAGIMGVAVGLAYRGYRPVVEIQFDGFVYPAVDQLVTQVARIHYRTGGAVRMPITVRIPYGGGIGAVEHHSESPEAYFAHTPGLRVVTCASPQDAHTMIRQAIACDDPVVFFEPKRRYWVKGEVDESIDDVPLLDRARVVVEGTDVTLATYGPLVITARDAALAAQDDGLSVEVVDLRSLSPLDLDTLEASVRKTGRLVVTHEAQAQRRARCGDRREHHRPLLRRPQGGAGARHRVRHPVPGREGRGALPARPRPDARRRRPRDGQTALPDRMEGVMTTIQTVTLPDLGEGLTESDLVEWTVAVGDTVELNQVVAEVETAKALVQLPSPYAGVVAELLVEPGATVPVGTALLTIAVEEPADGRRRRADAAPDGAGRRADAAGEPAAPERTAVLVGYGPLVEGSSRPRRRSRSADWAAAHAVADEVGLALAGGRIGPKVLPPVRKLAHDLGVDLNKMEGSGKDGMITREDVLRAVSGVGRLPGGTAARRVVRRAPARPSPRARRRRVPTPQPTPSPAREVRTPIAGVRKQTAAAMVASAFTAPHASTSLTVDVTPTLELLEAFTADRALEGHRITILTLVAKAVTIALGRNPSLNAHWDEAAGEIVQFGYVNLGIAAATPRGLLVPSIKDADRLRLPELADAIGAPDRGRAGGDDDARGPGRRDDHDHEHRGVRRRHGTPILVPGQAAILAMGAIRRRPWEFQDQIALRSVMTLSVSFDHRLVDGAEAARFLADVGAILARPGLGAEHGVTARLLRPVRPSAISSSSARVRADVTARALCGVELSSPNVAWARRRSSARSVDGLSRASTSTHRSM